MEQETRIAMWAVPRSLATVLLRAWSSRPDTAVWDEPLLPPYLLIRGEDLGCSREQALEGGRETDWRKVIAELTGPLPAGKSIAYQKHQPHNLLVEVMGTAWIEGLCNCFLIRDPREMLPSLHHLVPGFTFEQTGWADLKQLFDHVRRVSGRVPPVIDAGDLQRDPPGTLRVLCEAVGVAFNEAMLSWQPLDASALHETEKPWYESVCRSTGFQSRQGSPGPLPDPLLDIYPLCNTIYQYLYEYRLKVPPP